MNNPYETLGVNRPATDPAQQNDILESSEARGLAIPAAVKFAGGSRRHPDLP